LVCRFRSPTARREPAAGDFRLVQHVYKWNWLWCLGTLGDKAPPYLLEFKENVTPAAGNTVPPVISRVPEIYGPGAMLQRLVAKRKNHEPAEPVSNWGR